MTDIATQLLSNFDFKARKVCSSFFKNSWRIEINLSKNNPYQAFVPMISIIHPCLLPKNGIFLLHLETNVGYCGISWKNRAYTGISWRNSRIFGSFILLTSSFSSKIKLLFRKITCNINIPFFGQNYHFVFLRHEIQLLLEFSKCIKSKHTSFAPQGFLKIVPWRPRGSVVGFPRVATFDLLHLSLESSH